MPTAPTPSEPTYRPTSTASTALRSETESRSTTNGPASRRTVGVILAGKPMAADGSASWVTSAASIPIERPPATAPALASPEAVG